jgi:hypothetical protein
MRENNAFAVCTNTPSGLVNPTRLDLPALLPLPHSQRLRRCDCLPQSTSGGVAAFLSAVSSQSAAVQMVLFPSFLPNCARKPFTPCMSLLGSSTPQYCSESVTCALKYSNSALLMPMPA